MIEFLFQSTPPRGKRRGQRRSASLLRGFNPRPRAGSDVQRRLQRRHPVQFQSTPPRGKRLAMRLMERAAVMVSIHAPAREATSDASTSVTAGMRFNPRPRAGSDLLAWFGTASPNTSFNPRPRAGSDRAGAAAGPGDRLVSIHAPAREATSSGPRQPGSVASNSFQSTPPRGKRLHRRAGGFCHVGHVSIHAPAREATVGSGQRSASYGPFQSTPPRGKRPGPGVSIGHVPSRWRFQSTPPRGKRPRSAAGTPRPARVSIHAPAREATALWCCPARDSVSIHAPAREAT